MVVEERYIYTCNLFHKCIKSDLSPQIKIKIIISYKFIDRRLGSIVLKTGPANGTKNQAPIWSSKTPKTGIKQVKYWKKKGTKTKNSSLIVLVFKTMLGSE